MERKSILNDPKNSQELLDMTAGILFLLDYKEIKFRWYYGFWGNPACKML